MWEALPFPQPRLRLCTPLADFCTLLAQSRTHCSTQSITARPTAPSKPQKWPFDVDLDSGGVTAGGVSWVHAGVCWCCQIAVWLCVSTGSHGAIVSGRRLVVLFILFILCSSRREVNTSRNTKIECGNRRTSGAVMIPYAFSTVAPSPIEGTTPKSHTSYPVSYTHLTLPTTPYV